MPRQRRPGPRFLGRGSGDHRLGVSCVTLIEYRTPPLSGRQPRRFPGVVRDALREPCGSYRPRCATRARPRGATSGTPLVRATNASCSDLTRASCSTRESLVRDAGSACCAIYQCLGVRPARAGARSTKGLCAIYKGLCDGLKHALADVECARSHRTERRDSWPEPISRRNCFQLTGRERLTRTRSPTSTHDNVKVVVRSRPTEARRGSARPDNSRGSLG